jgi:hypothetical protein
LSRNDFKYASAITLLWVFPRQIKCIVTRLS